MLPTPLRLFKTTHDIYEVLMQQFHRTENMTFFVVFMIAKRKKKSQPPLILKRGHWKRNSFRSLQQSCKLSMVTMVSTETWEPQGFTFFAYKNSFSTYYSPLAVAFYLLKCFYHDTPILGCGWIILSFRICLEAFSIESTQRDKTAMYLALKA